MALTDRNVSPQHYSTSLDSAVNNALTPQVSVQRLQEKRARVKMMNEEEADLPLKDTLTVFSIDDTLKLFLLATNLK